MPIQIMLVLSPLFSVSSCPLLLPSHLLRFVSLDTVRPLTVGISLLPLIAAFLGRAVCFGCFHSCSPLHPGSASAPPLLVPVHGLPSICFLTFPQHLTHPSLETLFYFGLLCLMLCFLPSIRSRTSQSPLRAAILKCCCP